MSQAKTKSETKRINRYPGLRPFVKEDDKLFFGRSSEITQIVDSIMVNQTLVLFGKSGLGKSSLIHAGVAPRLLEENFFAINIRFLDQKQDPVGFIITEANRQLKEKNQIPLPVENGADLTRYFANWRLLSRPVLIFDQFEEFFYYQGGLREKMIAALASLLKQPFVFDVTDEDAAFPHVEDESLTGKKRMQIDVSPKVFFLIRSDRYSSMNEFAEKIPGLFNNRFELKPLLKSKAEHSIVLPAQIFRPFNPAEDFKVPSYTYSEEALRMILKSISNQEAEIESSQLQILCQELEEIAEKEFGSLPAEQRIIEPAHFKGESGIKEILNRFYWKQLEKLKSDPELRLSKDDVRIVRRLVENELVKGRKRVVQSEETVREFLDEIKPGIATIGEKDKIDIVVNRLLDLRLIREEESHRGKVYEISHDTLLESIIKLRDERVKQEREEKIKKQQTLLKSEKRRADQNEKLRKKAKEAEEAAIVARNTAKEKATVAKEKEKEAKRALRKAERAEANALRSQAQAKRSLAYARLGFVLVLIVALAIVFLLVRSRQQKSRLDRTYGQVLLLNGTRAYGDENHALAFNLVRAADSLLDKEGKLLDSVVAEWDLKEYSGGAQVSADGLTVACRYKNRMMQLFRIADTLRSRNKSLLISNADDFKISEDGTRLAVLDTVNKQFRIYSLPDPQSPQLDTTRIRAAFLPANYEAGSDKSFLTKTYFSFFANDTLCVYPFSSRKVLRRASKPEYLYQTVCNNKSIFLFGYVPNSKGESPSDFYVEEIGIAPGALTVKRSPGSYFLRGSVAFRWFVDSKTKIIFKILPDTVSAVFKLLQAPDLFIRHIGVYDSGYLVLAYLPGGGYYLQLPRANGQRKDSLIFLNRNSFLKYDLGSMVYNAQQIPLLVKKDTLITLRAKGPVRKQKMKGVDSAFLEEYGLEYSLSTDKDKIYVVNPLDGSAWSIGLDPLPEFMKIPFSPPVQGISPGDFLRSVGGKDFLYSGGRLERFRTGRPTKEYWESFYEPLDDFSKEIYGIQ